MAELRVKASIRDLIAFWIFGLANNYGYVIMLSAAGDIMRQEESVPEKHSNSTLNVCIERIDNRSCEIRSTGIALLADIIPTLIVKLTFPFFMHRIPFGMRHFITCTMQALSFLIVAFSWRIEVSLIGIVFASFSSGLGEICYLALTAHYSKETIISWSSGTGGAGVAGATLYAVLTEPHLMNLSSRSTLLIMLIVPIVFALTYWFMLTPAPTIYQMCLSDLSTWLVPDQFSIKPSTTPNLMKSPGLKKNHVGEMNLSLRKTAVDPSTPQQSGEAELRRKSSETSLSKKIEVETSSITFTNKLTLIVPLLKYMIPLGTVYFAEYLINQGIFQLVDFDCDHGLYLSTSSQYRWYQVLYQIGVFISRSSVSWIELSRFILYMLPLLQMINLILFFFESLYLFIPHIILVFVLILIEGLFGGAAYVNTFNRIHKEAAPEVKEFSLSVASVGDTIGILSAGITAIPLYNYICQRPYTGSIR